MDSKRDLVLVLHCVSPSIEIPELSRVSSWEQVVDAIELAFKDGGNVQLATANVVDAAVGVYEFQDRIDMLAKQGRYLLVVSPFQDILSRSEQREWWQPNDEPFCGMEQFGVDEFDSRMVCTDVQVAKDLFEELFSERKITDKMIEATLSVWSPKSKMP